MEASRVHSLLIIDARRVFHSGCRNAAEMPVLLCKLSRVSECKTKKTWEILETIIIFMCVYRLFCEYTCSPNQSLFKEVMLTPVFPSSAFFTIVVSAGCPNCAELLQPNMCGCKQLLR